MKPLSCLRSHLDDGGREKGWEEVIVVGHHWSSNVSMDLVIQAFLDTYIMTHG
jgi:hypothetical protein